MSIYFLDSLGVGMDLSKSTFMAFDLAKRNLTVQSLSFSEISTYDYQIYFELIDYPAISKSIPLTIKILRQPARPITIQPKPKSSYTLSPGSSLLLSFDVTSP